MPITLPFISHLNTTCPNEKQTSLEPPKTSNQPTLEPDDASSVQKQVKFPELNLNPHYGPRVLKMADNPLFTL